MTGSYPPERNGNGCVVHVMFDIPFFGNSVSIAMSPMFYVACSSCFTSLSSRNKRLNYCPILRRPWALGCEPSQKWKFARIYRRINLQDWNSCLAIFWQLPVWDDRIGSSALPSVQTLCAHCTVPRPRWLLDFWHPSPLSRRHGNLRCGAEVTINYSLHKTPKKTVLPW